MSSFSLGFQTLYSTHEWQAHHTLNEAHIQLMAKYEPSSDTTLDDKLW
jgi:hypothetical protein